MNTTIRQQSTSSHTHQPRSSMAMAILCCGLVHTTSVYAADWQVDKGHTHIGFSVGGFAGTSGSFGNFDGQIKGDLTDPAHLSTHFVVQAGSITTGLGIRDDALRGSSFFNVSKFPTVEFTSTQVTPIDAQRVKMRGDVTMLGVTKPAEFIIVSEKPIVDPITKNITIKNTATGTINRDDWGMSTYVPGVDREIKIQVDGVLTKNGTP